MTTIKHVEHGCFAVLLVLAAVVVLNPASVLAADRWCYTNFPDAVFCDDFDRYCVTPPVDPNAACDTCDRAHALDVWVPIECGARINLVESMTCGSDDDFVKSHPFGAKYPKGDQGYHNVDLASYANAKYGGKITGMKGTADNPLILEFVLNGQTAWKVEHANTYIELALDDGVNFIAHRAPTDYILSELCQYQNETKIVNNEHVMICQQDDPPAGCPDIATAPHHSAIAVGAVAYLDKTPCEHPTYLPYNNHLAVFDGYKWWTLPADFPHGGDYPFEIGPGYNYIKLILRETTMRVEMINDSGYHSWCEIPRDYQGSFNRMSLGFGKACLIDEGTWTCARTPGTDRIYTCIPTVSLRPGAPATVGPIYDNVALYGGEGDEVPLPRGACCLTNGGCIDFIDIYECETVNGGTWQGMATACEESICCPEPFADADGDGDVDQADFGMFQACFTGPGPVATPPAGKCTCFDRSMWAEGDDDIDDLDFVDFEACWSGPTIPVDPTCDDALHM